MAIPSRNSDAKEILSDERTFFVSTRVSMGRQLLQSERFANLLIDVLRSCVTRKKFVLHDFVIMPDHAYFLITLDATMSIKRPCN